MSSGPPTVRSGNSPIFASRDAGRVKSLADEIYAWAKTLVHNSAKDTATISKQAKPRMMMMMMMIMPYVVAMARAVQVKLDDEDDRDELQRGEEFIAVVQAEERRFDHVRARGGGGGSRRVGS